MEVDFKKTSKVAILRLLGRGTYRIFLAAQFYVDPLSFIEFGEFSCELVSKYSHLSSQHGFLRNMGTGDAIHQGYEMPPHP